MRLATVLRRVILRVGALVAVIAATTILLFGLIEMFPAILKHIQLQPIKYYALKSEYVEDSALVVVPRWPDNAGTHVRKGDLHKPEYGPAPDIASVYSYRGGFRANSAEPPYDVVVIGDSYVEIGEDDGTTLSEQLRQRSGLSTFNMGRGWYGPFQYLELLKRYAVPLRPRYVLFCFFAGNDIGDIEQYQQWQSGRVYYFYEGQLTRGFFGRLVTALADTREFVAREWIERTGAHRTTSRRGPASETVPSELGVIRLADGDARIAFGHWSRPESAEALLASPAWRTLREILDEFARTARQHEIVPVIVYIPTAMEVHGTHATEASGTWFKEQLAARLDYRNSAAQALGSLATDLNLTFIDLLPPFEQLATRGELLYYPFDSHWNEAGIRAAATHIAGILATEDRDSARTARH